MALTIEQANDINDLLAFLEGAPDANYDRANHAAWRLAEAAYKRLGAGVRGPHVDQWWEQRMGGPGASAVRPVVGRVHPGDPEAEGVDAAGTSGPENRSG